jgi:hypothetical protein
MPDLSVRLARSMLHIGFGCDERISNATLGTHCTSSQLTLRPIFNSTCATREISRSSGYDRSGFCPRTAFHSLEASNAAQREHEAAPTADCGRAVGLRYQSIAQQWRTGIPERSGQ